MAHERSITVKVDGKIVNIPSVVDGKVVSDRAAVAAFKAGKTKGLGTPRGGFKNFDAAVRAAKKRSALTRRSGRGL